MHIRVQAELFREALSKVLSVVDKRNTRPILGFVHITAANNRIEFSATDMEVSARICIEAEVEAQGTFCVNAKNTFDILRELPNAPISINQSEENGEQVLKITCGDIYYSLLIHPANDFPTLVFNNQVNQFVLSSRQVLDIIGKTSHAISTDETRLHLNGIYLQEIDSKLRAVATDGHRLSLLETELDENNIESLVNGIIIPKKGVNELKKLADTFLDGEITISVDESFLYASVAEQYFLSLRLIAREYPKYQAVIPSKTTFTMTADRNSFFDAVRRIKIMSNEKSNAVKVKLTKEEMNITANHPSLGDALETINIDYDGNEMEIGFNAKYLIDTLSTFDEGDISLELNNEMSPVIIKSNSLPNYLGIIMPLRL